MITEKQRIENKKGAASCRGNVITGSVKRMKRQPKEKKEEKRICSFCKREIYGEEPVYIKTKRRTELYLHRECFKKGI